MTINQLQAEMMLSLRQGDRERKAVISDLIAQIKKAAIDKGCRDNITEEFVNAEILKAKKIFQEMVDTCPAHRTDLLEDYTARLNIVKEYTPSLMDDEDMILYQIVTYYEGPNTKKDLMK